MPKAQERASTEAQAPTAMATGPEARQPAPKVRQPRGNAAAAQDAAVRGPSTGGPGAPPGDEDILDVGGFLAKMETIFGTSFQDVDVVRGEQARGNVRPGAVATTAGNTIYLGELFARLPIPQQEHALAHELTHVVQQSAGGGPGGHAEADADAAASAAVAGKTPDVGAGITPGAAHDITLGQVWDSTGGAALGWAGDRLSDAGEWALDRITDAGQLVAYIGRFGESLGRRAIDWLAEHRVEIVVSFLTLNPSTALLVYALRKLPAERIAAWIRSIDVKQAGRIVGIVLLAGAVVVIAPAVTALGPAALPLLKELSGPALVLLWRYAPEGMRELLKTKLVESWPVGVGLELDGAIGATFGYPIYLGAEAFFSVSHFVRGGFKLRRGGILRVAADTGVGAGGFVGLGGGGSSGRGGDGGAGGGGGGQRGGLGIGAEAGAQAQAGIKTMVIQEFDFPVAEDDAFLSFVITTLQADQSTSMTVLSGLSTGFRRVNPMSYNTSTRFEVKGYGEANAGASAGLRTGGADTQQGRDTWTRDQGARDNGSANWWQRWMSVGIFGRLTAEAGMGVEVRNSEWQQNAEGVRVPGKMEVSLYGEGQVGASIATTVPVIGAALPNFNWAPGVGVRAKWTLTGTPTDREPRISEPTWEVYTKTGTDDRYDGAASETSIGISNLNAETFRSVDTFLASIRGGAQVKRRFMVGTSLGRRYFSAADRQGAFNTMLPAEYRRYGFRIEGYVDLEAHLGIDQIREIFRAITTVYRRYQSGGEPLRQLYVDVMQFLSTGRAPPEVSAQAERIANAVLAGLDKLHLHGLVGLSVAAGGQLSAGAKVRLHGRVGAQITMDYNLLQDLQTGGAITVADIKQLIENRVSGGDAVDVPGQTGS
jgi:hypothetical protein